MALLLQDRIIARREILQFCSLLVLAAFEFLLRDFQTQT